MERSPWSVATRADVRARMIADRHYNRQKIGSPQFVPPGRCLVLYAPRTLWITSWPFAEYVKHRWPGAWICSAFRRERRRGHQASTLIRLAVAHTRHAFGEPPELGMVTFVDPSKVKAKANPGACFLYAGFIEEGMTEGGLLAFRMPPKSMPPPMPTGDDLFAQSSSP